MRTKTMRTISVVLLFLVSCGSFESEIESVSISPSKVYRLDTIPEKVNMFSAIFPSENQLVFLGGGRTAMHYDFNSDEMTTAVKNGMGPDELKFQEIALAKDKIFAYDLDLMKSVIYDFRSKTVTNELFLDKNKDLRLGFLETSDSFVFQSQFDNFSEDLIHIYSLDLKKKFPLRIPYTKKSPVNFKLDILELTNVNLVFFESLFRVVVLDKMNNELKVLDLESYSWYHRIIGEDVHSDDFFAIVRQFKQLSDTKFSYFFGSETYILEYIGGEIALLCHLKMKENLPMKSLFPVKSSTELKSIYYSSIGENIIYEYSLSSILNKIDSINVAQ